MYCYVPQGGRGQQARGLAVIIHVRDGADGIVDLVVHDGVNVHRHRVFRQNLRRKKVVVFAVR